MTDPRKVDCPKCGVKAGEMCRNLNGKESATYHELRRGEAQKSTLLKKWKH